jgi:hypothetical protein
VTHIHFLTQVRLLREAETKLVSLSDSNALLLKKLEEQHDQMERLSHKVQP